MTPWRPYIGIFTSRSHSRLESATSTSSNTWKARQRPAIGVGAGPQQYEVRLRLAVGRDLDRVLRRDQVPIAGEGAEPGLQSNHDPRVQASNRGHPDSSPSTSSTRSSS